MNIGTFNWSGTSLKPVKLPTDSLKISKKPLFHYPCTKTNFNMKRLYFLCFLIVFSFLLTINLYGQGVTTSGMSGLITDDGGEGLPSANIVAVHQPSGTRYFANTTPGGFQYSEYAGW